MRIARYKKSQDVSGGADVDLSLLNPLIEKYKSQRGRLIPILQGTQDIFGYIPTEAFSWISEAAGLEISDMYGVATFYAQFRLVPAGKHIVKVCHGTACHVQNANELTDSIKEILKVNDGETTADGIFTLESVACLGCCSLAPVMMIGDNTYGNLSGKEAVKIVRNIKKMEK